MKVKLKNIEIMNDEKYKELTEQSHINELQNRGLDPTQENIDKLVDELNTLTKRIDREKRIKIMLDYEQYKEGDIVILNGKNEAIELRRAIK